MVANIGGREYATPSEMFHGLTGGWPQPEPDPMEGVDSLLEVADVIVQGLLDRGFTEEQANEVATAVLVGGLRGA